MTVFDNMAADLFATWPEAVSATFTPKAGDTVTVTVVVEKSLKHLPDGFDAQTWGNSSTIEYILADIGREAVTGERFDVNGTIYTVVDLLENDGRFCKVIVR